MKRKIFFDNWSQKPNSGHQFHCGIEKNEKSQNGANSRFGWELTHKTYDLLEGGSLIFLLSSD
jgi:hypothetical protein